MSRRSGWMGVTASCMVVASLALSCTADAAEPTPPSATSPATAAQPPEVLADVAFVDERTGATTPLPDPIRAVGDAVVNVRVSPDGTMLAFDDGVDIYVANVDGSDLRQITPEGGATEEAPSWSPDGRSIVFTRGSDTSLFPGSGVFIADVATGRIRKVTPSQRQIWYPNYSSDGRTILYTSRHGRFLGLWTVPATGGRAAPLMPGAFGAYSPDGSQIAFRRSSYNGDNGNTQLTNSGIWVANADGSERRGIGTGWISSATIDPITWWPVWSPDGRRIAFRRRYGDGIAIADVRANRIERTVAATVASWLDDDTLIVSQVR